MVVFLFLPVILACLAHISNYTVDALRTFNNDDDGEKTLAKLILLSPTLSTRGLSEKKYLFNKHDSPSMSNLQDSW